MYFPTVGIVTNSDFDLMRGDTFTKRLSITDSDGEPVDVHTWLFLGQVRTSPDAEETIGEMAFDISDAENGVVIASIPAVDTENFDTSVLYYDIQATQTNGTVKTLVRGQLNVIFDISRI